MRMLFDQIKKISPGIFLAGLLAVVAEYLAELSGTTILGFDQSPVSSVMVALILGGVVANTVGTPARCQAGADYSVRRILKFGIILLGFRLSLYEAAEAGLRAIPVVLASILTAVILVFAVSKLLGIDGKLGTLIGVGTAICGVTAIVATAPTINAQEEETGYAVATITFFGLVATLAYPFVGHFLFAGVEQSVGLWLGTAVQDTSQVTGAALVYGETYESELALDIAVVTKLLRNTLMIVVIPLAGVRMSSRDGHSGEASSKFKQAAAVFPGFVAWFLGFSFLRSLGDAMLSRSRAALFLLDAQAWVLLGDALSLVAVACLLIALAAVGLRTDIRRLMRLGFKPFLVGLVAAFAVGGASALTILFLM